MLDSIAYFIDLAIF